LFILSIFVTLSRRKHGFESRWGYQEKPPVFGRFVLYIVVNAEKMIKKQDVVRFIPQFWAYRGKNMVKTCINM